MNILDEIFKSDKKPKEKMTLIADIIKKNKRVIVELIDNFENYSDGEKGNCMQGLEYVIKENPKFAIHCIDFAIKHINDKLPRVKWEADTIVGDAAQVYPEEVMKAIPKLLQNTKDKGTVVRWSAAFALGEIVKYNPRVRTSLIPKIETIIKKEKNNGVRNVYLKVLKVINK